MGGPRSNLSSDPDATMSVPSIAPLLPFRRVRVVSQRVQAGLPPQGAGQGADRRLPASQRFAGMLRRHRHGIVAHARCPIHTGRIEGVDDRIKVIKRRSYGFRDPDNCTLRVKQAFPGK